MDGEEWREVVGVPKYEVSSWGRVRSNTTRSKGKILKTAFSGKGPAKYRCVSLSRGHGRRCTKLVHQLVLEAFKGPRPANAISRHLDGDRMNCAANNLLWGTRQENMADRRQHGRGANGERNVRAKLTLKQVLDIRAHALTKSDIQRLAITLGVRVITIQKILSGKSWR